jgi:hypothetical protein
MLLDATPPVPASLMTLLSGFAPLFTAPSFRTFCGLACGFLAQTGKRTVCGMLARRMTGMLAGALPGRDVHVAADSAYAGEELRKLGKQITWTTRLRKDAAIYGLPPARTGRRGRPRVKGDRLPALAKLAGTAAFVPVTVTRYGKTAAISAAAITCLWYSVFGSRPVQVVLVRDRSAAGYDLAW